MHYNEKLSEVLYASAMATESDLDKLHAMTCKMVPDASAGKHRKDRADLCSYLPYIDENDTELLTTSARTLRTNK